MVTKTTLVEIEHDEGYGDNLLEYLNITLRGKDMIGRAIYLGSLADHLVIKSLREFCDSERFVAKRQAEEARDVQDFRAMDRHASYAQAMQKVLTKIADMQKAGE